MNRLLKTAVLHLILHGDVTPARQRRLKSTLLAMGGVEVMSVGDLRQLHWDSLRFHHGNHSYRLLMGMCRLVLDKRLLSDADGAVNLTDLLGPQEPNALYERFVLAHFRRRHPHLHTGVPWVSGGIEDAPALLPEPHTDIILIGPERTLIIDTRYYRRILGSHYDKSILSPANRSQVYSYAMHETSDPRQAGREIADMLLCAQTAVDPPIRETWTETGHRFHVRTLDLNRDFTKIAAQLGDIVALLTSTRLLASRERRRSAPPTSYPSLGRGHSAHGGALSPGRGYTAHQTTGVRPPMASEAPGRKDTPLATWNVPGHYYVLEAKRHGTDTNDADVHKGDCLAAGSPCYGIREGLPAPVGMMGDASRGIFSRNTYILAGGKEAGRK